MTNLRLAALLLLVSLSGCRPVALRLDHARSWNIAIELAPEIPDREAVREEIAAQLRAELGALLASPGNPAASGLHLEIRAIEPDSMGYLARFGGLGLLGATLVAAQGKGWDGLAYAVLGSGAAGAWMLTSLTRGILRSGEEDRLGYQPLRFRGRLSSAASAEQLDLTQLRLRKLHRPLLAEAARDPVLVRREGIHALAKGIALALKG